MLLIAIIATWVLLDIAQSMLVAYDPRRGFDLDTFFKGFLLFGTSFPLIGLFYFADVFERRFWNQTTILLACAIMVLFIALILLLVLNIYIPVF